MRNDTDDIDKIISIIEDLIRRYLENIEIESFDNGVIRGLGAALGIIKKVQNEVDLQ